MGVFNDSRSRARGIVTVEGYFLPNGSSAIAASSVVAPGVASVAHAGSTGKYTLTLNEKYVRLLSAQFSVQRSADTWTHVTLGAVDVTGAKTIGIKVWEEAAGAVGLADMASNASNKIYFRLALQTSQVLS